jgi:hypothetical protein
LIAHLVIPSHSILVSWGGHNMPTTVFALILFSVLVAGAITAMAISIAPASTLVPIVLIGAIGVRMILRRQGQ